MPLMPRRANNRTSLTEVAVTKIRIPIFCKYSIVDCSDKKKFAEVPVAVKIRSNRSVKYALELIRDTMSRLSIIRTDKQQEVITLPYEDTESLIKKGFIKEIYLGKTDKNTSVVKLNVGNMLKHKTENKD